MEKIKKLILNVSQGVKNVIKNYPTTIMFITITTMFVAICLEQHWMERELFYKISLFGAISSMGIFTVEVYFKDKLKRIIGYILSTVIAIVFVNLIYQGGVVTSHGVKNTTIMVLIGYVLILGVLSVYKTFKDSNFKFEEYALKVFANVFQTSIVYGILNIGISLIILIFTTLILDGGANIYQRMFTILFGLFYVPGLIYSLTENLEKEVNNFIKALVRYVLLPLVTSAFVIIYIYILKIFITQIIPSNEIFRILAAIFVFACPVWIMSYNFVEQNKILGKITKTLPYLYIPFLFLEMYSIGIRIQEFGLTPLRHISCLFIVFQITVIFFTIYKKREKISHLLIAGAILVFIATMTPLNIQRLSKINQKNILIKYLPNGASFQELDDGDKAKVKSSYVYLNSQHDSDKYIPEYIDSEMRSEITKFYYSDNTYAEILGKSEYISYYDQGLDLNIENYSQIEEVETPYSYDNNAKNMYLYPKNKAGQISVNLSSLVEKMLENYTDNADKWDEYMKSNNIVEVNESQDLYITRIYFHYNYSAKSFDSVNVSGYLLTK